MEDEKLLKVVTVSDELKFRSICSFLEEHQIPYLVQGQDDFLRLISGFDLFEKDIYVSEQDFDRTLELMTYFMDSLEDSSNLYFDSEE